MDYSKLAKIADATKVTVGSHNDPKTLYKQYRDLSYDITNDNKELQNLKRLITEGLTDRIKNSIEGVKNVRVKVDLEGVSPEGVRYPVTISFEKDGSKEKKVMAVEDIIANNYKVSDSKIADSAKEVKDGKSESITPEEYAELVKDWTDDSKVKFNVNGHKVVLKSEVWDEDDDVVYNLTVRVDGKTAVDLVETDSIPVPDYDEILRAVSEVSDSKKPVKDNKKRTIKDRAKLKVVKDSATAEQIIAAFNKCYDEPYDGTDLVALLKEAGVDAEWDSENGEMLIDGYYYNDTDLKNFLNALLPAATEYKFDAIWFEDLPIEGYDGYRTTVLKADEDCTVVECEDTDPTECPVKKGNVTAAYKDTNREAVFVPKGSYCFIDAEVFDTHIEPSEEAMVEWLKSKYPKDEE